jgi:hypothetical protein
MGVFAIGTDGVSDVISSASAGSPDIQRQADILRMALVEFVEVSIKVLMNSVLNAPKVTSLLFEDSLTRMSAPAASRPLRHFHINAVIFMKLPR